jgi:hypothetical protein
VFCSYFVLSFDACIVTITWSLLFVVIALWVICLTCRLLSLLEAQWFTDVGVFPCISSADEKAFGFTCGSVVPAGVTVMLGLCNPLCRGNGETSKHGLLYPLVCIPCCDTVI